MNINNIDNDKTEKKIIEAVENIKVPQRLAPENMMSEIEKRKYKKKQTVWKQVTVLSSAAAVLALAVGIGTANYHSNFKSVKTEQGIDSSSEIKKTEFSEGGYKAQEIENVKYKEIYKRLKEENKIKHSMENGYDMAEKTFGVQAETDNAVDIASEETNSEVSQTYSQAHGIEEMDTVKACKQGVFYANNQTIEVVKTADTSISEINIADYLSGSYNPDNINISGMLLNGDNLTVLVTQLNECHYNLKNSEDTWDKINTRTAVISFDVSDIDNISLLNNYTVDGELKDAHITDGKLYLCTAYDACFNEQVEYDKKNPYFVPEYTTDGEDCILEEKKIFCPKEERSSSYNIISSIDLQSGEMLDVCTVMGDFNCLYMKDGIYIVNTSYDYDYHKSITNVTKISYDENGILNPYTACSLEGYVHDKYSLEQDGNGNFYAALTDNNNGINVNYLVKLDENLQQTGFSEYFGENETIKSASFDENKAYIVTYRNTDPLFTIDLNSLEILSETKVTGFSTTLRKMGDYLVGFGEENTTANYLDGIKLSVFGGENYELIDSVSWINNENSVYSDEYGDYEYNEYRYYSSTAENDPKAIMIDENKNIIAFGIKEENFKDNHRQEAKNLMEVYSLDENGKLNNLCEIDFAGYFGEPANVSIAGVDRFAYVDNYLYAFDECGCVKVNMNSWEVEKAVEFD